MIVFRIAILIFSLFLIIYAVRIIIVSERPDENSFIDPAKNDKKDK